MSMCLSTGPSSYQKMLHDMTGAEIIYSTLFQSGTLYAMIHTKPEKRHATLDKAIVSLDKSISKPGITSFVSISDILSGKVKTFQAGEHSIDEHYIVLFANKFTGAGQKPEPRAGVKTWTPETARNEDALAQSARQENDMKVQGQAMEEDPSAFGVDANDIIHRPEVPKKRHAEFSHASPKRRLADPISISRSWSVTSKAQTISWIKSTLTTSRRLSLHPNVCWRSMTMVLKTT